MIKTVGNKLLMLIYYILGAIILEAVAFSILGFGGLPEYFMMDFAIILFVAICVFVIPNFTAQYVIYTIILVVQAIFAYVNYSLYTIYGDLFTFDMFGLIGEAGAAMNSSFIYLSVILKVITVLLAITILGAILLKRCRSQKINVKQHFSIFNIILMVSLQCFAISHYVSIRNYIDNLTDISKSDYASSDTFYMNTSLMKARSYSKFGTYGYFLNMLVNKVGGLDYKLRDATIKYFKNSEMYNSSSVFGQDNDDKQDNIIVFMMESTEWYGFGDGNYDSGVNNLSRELTPNMYDLIYGEFTSEIDTSTGKYIDNLDDNSLIFKNFFSKAKTNMSEGIGIIGNYPIGSHLNDVAGTKYNTKLKAFDYTLPNVLKSKGYTTSYIHSNNISFYKRANTHKNIGFDTVIGKDLVTNSEGQYIYTGDDLLWDNWENEGEFAKNAMKYIVPDTYKENPFYSFYLNVSSHGAYDKPSNTNDKDVLKYLDYVKYGEANCEIDKNGHYKFNEKLLEDKTKKEEDFYTTWYSNLVKNYKQKDPSLIDLVATYECGIKGLDDAIGEIVKTLKSKTYDDGTSLYDNTTILLYSDHYSYYHNVATRLKGFSDKDYSSIEVNTVPCVLSSPRLKALNKTNGYKYVVSEDFVSAYDIVPSILDLMGISFNQNLYMGSSVFADKDEALNYTINGDVRNMKVYYSLTGGLFSREVYTYNCIDYVAQNQYVDETILDLFEKESYKVLTKINYLNILNYYHLYQEIK